MLPLGKAILKHLVSFHGWDAEAQSLELHTGSADLVEWLLDVKKSKFHNKSIKIRQERGSLNASKSFASNNKLYHSE